MTGYEQERTDDERLVQGLRAIWVEVHKSRVAVQWLLAIQVTFIVLGVLLALVPLAFVGG